ncbi:MAG: nitroreductase [Oscillospiraceae bacterium]|jgi:hypothetical protein|nr:nitroreductase [Oscillospiraceae bacterium]MDD3260384.1 nitroreductase family protein [Oscillospiraceae bacterium]
MTILESIEARHAVRSYLKKPIPADLVQELNREIAACNQEGGLHIQLVTNEPKAFDSMMAHYGNFHEVQNYIALVGKKSPGLEEKLGYYGERAALKAQCLGLNTCWVAMSFSKGTAKKSCTVTSGESLVCVLSLGYGETQGIPHQSKPLSAFCPAGGTLPAWFTAGVKAAALAPTAMNQQKFRFELSGDTAKAVNLGGPYSKIDLGIVKYHFEAGSGRKCL